MFVGAFTPASIQDNCNGWVTLKETVSGYCFSHSSGLANFIDSSRRVAHQAPIRFSAAMNDHLIMVGTPSTAIDSSSGV